MTQKETFENLQEFWKTQYALAEDRVTNAVRNKDTENIAQAMAYASACYHAQYLCRLAVYGQEAVRQAK